MATKGKEKSAMLPKGYSRVVSMVDGLGLGDALAYDSATGAKITTGALAKGQKAMVSDDVAEFLEGREQVVLL